MEMNRVSRGISLWAQAIFHQFILRLGISGWGHILIIQELLNPRDSRIIKIISDNSKLL